MRSGGNDAGEAAYRREGEQARAARVVGRAHLRLEAGNVAERETGGLALKAELLLHLRAQKRRVSTTRGRAGMVTTGRGVGEE